MGMFDNNADYGGGGYLRVAGDYILTIKSVEYDDNYFQKYNVEAEVASGPHKGEIVQSTIPRVTEKYMKDKDRALGGFSFAKVGAYVVGAGITDEVNALPKPTMGVIGKMLVGKKIKGRVQLTYKSQQLANDGETQGLYYEIGRIYKRSEWQDEDKDGGVDLDWLPPARSLDQDPPPFDQSQPDYDIPF